MSTTWLNDTMAMINKTITKAMTLAQNKLALIAARRAGDDELAKVLSQERQALKRKRFCIDCDVRIARGLRCYLHHVAHRFYQRMLP